MSRKTKTTFQLDTPYSQTPWPHINPKDQETILELLVNLLSPIGNHRSAQASLPSSKRPKKRRRSIKFNDKGLPLIVLAKEDSIPPAPECSYLLIGLNSITRHLVATCNSLTQQPSNAQDPISTHPSPQLSAIFVPKTSQPPILSAHLPQLIALSSLTRPSLPPTRLVKLPAGCEARLCASLGIPRAGFIGVMADAPHAKALLGFVLEHVPSIEVGWLKEVQRQEYRPVRVNAVETKVGAVEKKEKEVKK